MSELIDLDKKIEFVEEEVPAVASELKNMIDGYKIISFSGPLGAGKTTMIRELLSLFKVEQGVVKSPTFTTMNVYKGDGDKVFYHFDLYRLESVGEFMESGFDEYLGEGSLSLIEWPEVILPILEGRSLLVELDYSDCGKKRSLKLSKL